MASLGSWMEVSVSFSNREVLISPMGSPIGEIQDHKETFQGHLGQDLPQFTEPGVPLGHPKEGKKNLQQQFGPLLQ